LVHQHVRREDLSAFATAISAGISTYRSQRLFVSVSIPIYFFLRLLPLGLKEKYTLKVPGNEILTKISGPKKDEAILNNIKRRTLWS
jgi:hypothetical protein